MAKRSKRRPDLDALSPIEVENYTEFFKERIYSTITLLALLATLWRSAEHMSPLGAAASVFGTAVALWLAIGISSRMSYQVVNGKRMSLEAYGKILRSHAGLLIPAMPPLVMIAFSATGLISLEVGLVISIVLLLISFAGFSYYAGRKIHSNGIEILLTTLLELSLGIGIIALKVLAGH